MHLFIHIKLFIYFYYFIRVIISFTTNYTLCQNFYHDIHRIYHRSKSFNSVNKISTNLRLSRSCISYLLNSSCKEYLEYLLLTNRLAKIN